MQADIGILVLCLVMFLGSFVVGFLPTCLKTSRRVMNLIAIFGAGLLVGVALIIIIPEGTLTLVEALKDTKESASWYLGSSLVGGFTLMVILDQGFMIIKERCTRLGH